MSLDRTKHRERAMLPDRTKHKERTTPVDRTIIEE